MENDCDDQEKGTCQKPSRKKFRLAVIILTPLLVTVVLLALILQASYQHDGIDFRMLLTKMTKIFIQNRKSSDNINIAKARIKSVNSAIKAFLLNTGTYPASLNDLIVDPGLFGWAGPYLKPSQINDPWGRPFLYNPNGKRSIWGYDLISYGQDGKPGGKGDNADFYND
jgi:type II secretion system protein G